MPRGNVTTVSVVNKKKRKRARILSQAHQGATAAFTAVPSDHFLQEPTTFINSIQLALRAPVSALAGCGDKCTCGARLDCYGDHLMSCNQFISLRTMGHDLIEKVVGKMSRAAGYTISWDSKKKRSASIGYSPHHTPDLTLLHGASNTSHVLIDVVGPSVVTQDNVAGASATPLSAAAAAEGSKHDMFGNVGHHQVLPFAVEDGGALGKEAKAFFNKCKAVCGNKLSGLDFEHQTWTAHGFSNFFLQSISVANYRGLGHLFRIAGDEIRSRSD